MKIAIMSTRLQVKWWDKEMSSPLSTITHKLNAITFVYLKRFIKTTFNILNDAETLPPFYK